jgi:IS5 family transposase
VRQIDKEARITIKNKKMLYGYKLHTKVDADSKCIVKMKVTPANEADNMHFVEFLDENTDKEVYADKGYVGKKIPEKINNQVHERADRGHPLSEEAEARNRQRTPIRARVEHVYGCMKGSMKCGIIRCVGLLRTQFQLFMLGLVYNMKRYGFELQKLANKHI